MIAVIADDLTGAAEIAGLGWRYGLTADMLHRDEVPSRAAVVVYDSDSRGCPPGEAARRVAGIVRRVQQRRPAWIYKKVDSVLRGNPLAEVQAIQNVLGAGLALLVPANPSAGRVIRDGKYFIRGVPINRTDFRHDPAYPRHSASVLRMLGTLRPRVALREPAAGDLPGGVVVGAAATRSDMLRWARRVDPRMLPVGGADFFAALLQCDGLRARQSLGRPRKAPGTTALFVSGSLAESSIRFLDQCRARGWPVLRMPVELFADRPRRAANRSNWARRIIEQTESHPKVAVAIGQPTRPGRSEGSRLGRILAATIQEVLSVAQPDRVCIEGGATAALLLERLGIRRMAIECEFATGVAGFRLPGGAGPLVVFKPGSYAWPSCLYA